MRLIDADALREHWVKNGNDEYIYDIRSFLCSVDEAPTIDPETLPIVQELRGKIKSLEYQHDIDNNRFEQIGKKYNSLLGEFAETKKQLAKVTAERDTAIQDLKSLLKGEIESCDYCKHKSEDCDKCSGWVGEEGWEWHGLQESDSK